MANTLINLYNNTNSIPTEVSSNKDELGLLKLEHPTILAAINGITDTLMTKLDEKSLVDESKLSKIETELCKIRTDYTANSKKVVLRKSKIQITKYKIQKKVCHIIHMSELLTTSL